MHQEPVHLAFGGAIASRFERAVAAVRASAPRSAFEVEVRRQTEELRRCNLRLAVLRQRLAAPLLWEGDQA